MSKLEQITYTPSILDRFPRLKEIPDGRYPSHLLLIPDGNGRWAKKEFEGAPILGHQKGANVIRETLRELRELPIPYVTLWGFAADNWKRPEEEVGGLMQLFQTIVIDSFGELLENNVRVVHLGRKDRIPENLRNVLEWIEQETQNNTGQTLCLAIDFGGEDQERRIMQALIDNPPPKGTTVTPEFRKKYFDGGGKIPSADLIIRTSGEKRTSDLGWLATNSEFYSIEELLPDIKTDHIIEALVNYSQRERRFGTRPGKK